MVSRISVSNNPNKTISPIFSAPRLIDIFKMKHHANPEYHYLLRGKLSQVNTTSFKTVGVMLPYYEIQSLQAIRKKNCICLSQINSMNGGNCL